MPTPSRPGFQPRTTPTERRAFFDQLRKNARMNEGISDNGTFIDALASDVSDLQAAVPMAAWPIGSVFISVVPDNPADLLGGGTWVAFGTGRVLVGQNGADVDFDVAEETGGAKTHTLATANLPAHTHAIDHDHPLVTSGSQSVGHTHSMSAHTHTHTHTHPLRDIRTNATAFGSSGALAIASATGTLVTPENSGAASVAATGAPSTPDTGGASASHTHDVNLPNFTGTSGSTGSGTAVNHMPPYIVVYMWKRTA